MTAFHPHATVALSGDQLLLTFEDHSVLIPASTKGLTLIKEILRQRSEPNARTVGTKGAPIQHMIRAMLAEKQKRPAKKKLTLEDIGL